MAPIKDYTGRKFSRLLAVERIPERGKETRYRCICDCGKETIVKACHLTSNATKSCGCLNSESRVNRPPRQKRTQPVSDMTGMRCGSLLVNEFVEVNIHGKDMWRCTCDCGEVLIKERSVLRNNQAISCGCTTRQKTSERNKTHGMSKTREYKIWKAMWSRCTQPSMKFYVYYADKVPPDRWRSFLNFYSDMGPIPSDQHSIDRIDNSKPYGPDNCRWATNSQQARNKTNTTMVHYRGSVMSLSDACDLSGLSYKYIRGRTNHFKDVEFASNGLFKKVA